MQEHPESLFYTNISEASLPAGPTGAESRTEILPIIENHSRFVNLGGTNVFRFPLIHNDISRL